MNLPDFSLEKKLWKKYELVAGLDEVGRGAFAGPVVAAAVVFEKTFSEETLHNRNDIVVDDSKKLSPEQRELTCEWIKQNSVCWGIGEASVTEINKHGMSKATNKAFRRAVFNANNKLSKRVEYLLIDAFYIPHIRHYPVNRNDRKLSKQRAIKCGDSRVFSIAAASIVAKVYRDDLMISVSKNSRFSKFMWYSNMGYPTEDHTKALVKHGPTRMHRKQFVETYFENKGIT